MKLGPAHFAVEERDEIYISPIDRSALCPYRMSNSGENANESGQRLRLDLNAIDRWTFQGELMSRCVTYYDHAKMLRQMADR